MQRIKEPPKDDLDFKYIKEAERIRKKEEDRSLSIEPSELPSIELRLREGSDYKGDEFEFDGEMIFIPQLSFLEIRKANREGMKIFDKTDLGKRILMIKRTDTISRQEALDKITHAEEMSMMEMTDIEDLWLVFLL